MLVQRLLPTINYLVSINFVETRSQEIDYGYNN